MKAITSGEVEWDENGHVKLKEEKNEFTGRNMGDVVSELMRSAPQASYTQTAISASMMDEEDDALKRLRQLK